MTTVQALKELYTKISGKTMEGNVTVADAILKIAEAIPKKKTTKQG